ncbi:MAG: UDP-N-acetylglucosamine--N-acetylmuramyl-(pentapeptide) pyrophosphoryl-undecaprenol N-acetylglucosamine transferase [Clostridia bacterium]|nr:UDP-N-acetylglucosamine--N-acetylmuramyl-(pentapeptide) pyrophosphoryl-undecaprenol N-acetylglucosamine transferase [Clostridia bacterium]
MKKTIALTGGGTAGHVTTNLNLIPYLIPNFDKIIYIGSQTGLERDMVKDKVAYYPITTTKLNRSLSISNLFIPYRLYQGYKEAKKLLIENNVNVVFSKGGYVSLPVVLACNKLHIPLIIHESDLTLGLANRIAARFANTVCTTFKETATMVKNGVYTGAPLNNIAPLSQNVARVKNMYNLPNNRPICLVVGGSLGAKNINDLVITNLDYLTKTHFILHITGKGKSPKIKHENYASIEFTLYIKEILSLTDIAITRGGANMIFELLQANIPMLIIPLEKGSRGDQVKNGSYFAEHNYALLLRERDSKNFVSMFDSLIARAPFMRKVNHHILPNNSLDKLAEIIIKTAK